MSVVSQTCSIVSELKKPLGMPRVSLGMFALFCQFLPCNHLHCLMPWVYYCRLIANITRCFFRLGYEFLPSCAPSSKCKHYREYYELALLIQSILMILAQALSYLNDVAFIFLIRIFSWRCFIFVFVIDLASAQKRSLLLAARYHFGNGQIILSILNF